MLKEYRVKSRNGKEVYAVWIDEGKGYNSCSCKHGSLFRFSERAKKNDEICWHIKEILKCLEIKKKIEGG